MDPYFKHYEMARLRFGLDAELDPQELAIATQTNDKNVCAKMSPYLINLKRMDASGVASAAGTGFMMMNGKHCAITSAHVVPAGQREGVIVYLPDGASCPCQFIASDDTVDVGVIKVSKACLLPTIHYRTASLGDQVYILGFSGSSSDLNFTKGMVSSLHQGGFTTNAYADNGFSGGPVFSLHMELLGMVRGGAGYVEGRTNQQVRCVNADVIEGFLRAVIAVKPDAVSWP